MVVESTIEDILEDVPRFRILCVGHSGVGKSSLINKVFGITEVKASRYAPSDATIDREFVSEENKHLVLHDSKGFELGNDENFDLVARFLRERHNKRLLKDRLHAIWLCIETPRAGGRVLEEGDKKLLALAHELQTPVVVVFTKYDLLVWSKCLEEEEEEDGAEEEIIRERGKVNATRSLAASVSSLDRSTATLRIPTPPYINISLSKGYEKSIADLVDITCRIAQRASLGMKVAACFEKGVDSYYRALSESAPGVANTRLGQCLAQVHQDIVTCWNFTDRDKVLVGTEFQKLILYLVEEVHTRSSTTPAPQIDRIRQSVNLINVSTIPIAQPVAIAYFFTKWVRETVLQRAPELEGILIAYTVDLISVLKTLKPDRMINWDVLKEAFEDYERSNERRRVHAFCRSIYDEKNLTLTRESLLRRINQLLDEPSGSDSNDRREN